MVNIVIILAFVYNINSIRPLINNDPQNNLEKYIIDFLKKITNTRKSSLFDGSEICQIIELSIICDLPDLFNYYKLKAEELNYNMKFTSIDILYSCCINNSEKIFKMLELNDMTLLWLQTLYDFTKSKNIKNLIKDKFLILLELPENKDYKKFNWKII